MNHDVFVSYSTKDKGIADALVRHLEEHGVACWIAPRDIPSGMEYADLVVDAIETSKLVLVLFSDAAQNSRWVRSEINRALSESKDIIPVRIEDMGSQKGMEVYLGRRQWVDLLPDPETKFGEVLSAVRDGVKRTGSRRPKDELERKIKWKYKVKNGEATITWGWLGFLLLAPAIPVNTAGALVVPSLLGGYKVTSIGMMAFYNCRRLTEVTIPKGVTSIGDLAFEDCSRLMSVRIPSSVTSIGLGAFEGCSRLMSVRIPSSVTNIGLGAFKRCHRLTTVTLPKGLTSIEHDVFCCCWALTSVTIPPGVTNIEWEAFRGCSGLKSVTFEGLPPKGVENAGIGQSGLLGLLWGDRRSSILVRYPAKYESEWLPVLKECGFSKHEAVE